MWVEGALLHTPTMADDAARSLCVVDCGSGSSRMSKYEVDDDGVVRESRYVPSGTLPTLAPALASGNGKRWVAALADLLQREQCPVVIGTTGGVRAALDRGASRARGRG